MNGLKLTREYFKSTAEPSLKTYFPALYPRLAAGLVGNGSECLGYDDELSRDHDWGIDFFIWTTEADKGFIPKLSEWKLDLFETSPPEFSPVRSGYGAQTGVMTCGGFYQSLIGAPEGPKTLGEWLRVPEENFALATNGEVFIDGAGEFSKTRNSLQKHYPEDLRKKKIAAKCMAIAQTGQYNHKRTAKRADWVTLRTVLSRFTDSAIALVFLLNRVYRPYYKWAYRMLADLPVLGNETARLLLEISETGGFDEGSISAQQAAISSLCGLFTDELRSQGLSASEDPFLAVHGEEIQLSISDPFLRTLPAQQDV